MINAGIHKPNGLILDLEDAVAGPKRKVKNFDSSCFTGEYITGIELGYFEKLEQARSDAAKAKSG